MTVPITRSAHPALLWPGVKSIFGGKYNEYPPEWSQIFSQETSTKAYEKFVEEGGFGMAPIKAEGAPIEYDSDTQGYTATFTHVVYAKGFIVTREAIEDNQYAEVAERRARKLAKAMRVTAETVHANVLNRGFSGSYPIGDGKALFATDHPTATGAQSNLLTAADLSEASLEAAAIQISKAKDSAGLPIASRIKRLIVGPDNVFNVERILGSTLQSASESNNLNALKSMGTIPEVVVNHYLTDSDAWFIQTEEEDGLVSFWRRKPTLQQDTDFDTENARSKSSMRFAAGVGDWRAVYGNAGS
ncbi:MAG: hypothetical protein EON59_00615 [Alphaproteobacteria bacterium]|nr:MAG: hypothetical protein EON59_00615 [Alphaproteobacteria bacterium]